MTTTPAKRRITLKDLVLIALIMTVPAITALSVLGSTEASILRHEMDKHLPSGSSRQQVCAWLQSTRGGCSETSPEKLRSNVNSYDQKALGQCSVPLASIKTVVVAGFPVKPAFLEICGAVYLHVYFFIGQDDQLVQTVVLEERPCF